MTFFFPKVYTIFHKYAVKVLTSQKGGKCNPYVLKENFCCHMFKLQQKINIYFANKRNEFWQT